MRRQEKFDAATEEARQAIGLEPDEAFPQYVLSAIMYGRNRFPESKTAIQEAIRLEPDDADYWGQLAAIEYELRDWNASLAAADRGLQVDPEHVGCTNLRVQALTKLGRRTDADAAVEAALRRQPDNAYTHANRGWTLLEQRKPDKAMEHFREALRLDPEMEWARAGIVEALQARHLIYRWLLGYAFWMSRLSRQAQWGILIGGYVAYRFLGNLQTENPALRLITRGLMVAYIVFALLTWISRPVFNTLLRFNKFGRMALSREQTVASNWVCATLVPAIACGVLYAVNGDVVPLVAGITLAFTTIFVSATFNCSRGWPRMWMAGLTVVFLLWGAAVCGLLLAAESADKAAQAENAERYASIALTMLNIQMVSALVLQFAANGLAQARVKR